MLTFVVRKSLTIDAGITVYMAKAPGSASAFDGAGNVWFKVKEVTAQTDGGKTINWPSLGNDIRMCLSLFTPLNRRFQT